MDNRFPNPSESCPNPQGSSAQPQGVQPQGAQPLGAQPQGAQPQGVSGAQPYPAAPPYPGVPPQGVSGAPVYGFAYAAPPQPSPRLHVQYRLLDGKTAPDKLPRRRKLLPLIVSAVCVLAALVAVLASMWYDQRSRRPAAVSPDHSPAFVVAELPENLDDGLSAAEIMQKVGPSVVCIDVYLPGSLAVAGSASGIVMNEQGYIVTNAHVVEDVSGLRVTLSDGRAFDGVFVGSDKATDLAVIQIKAEQLTPAQFGDSTQLQVGERVLAIGNAAGLLSSSATQGIVSGLGRQIGPFDDFGGDVELIQTDAALNPGNSGGALVNRFGQVIGISSAKLLSVEFEGIGFAIPIHILRPVAQALIASGHVERAALGISVEALNAVTGSLNDLPSQGLYIQSVEKASNLNSFDIVAGDIMIKADGAPMHTAADLSRVLAKYKPGDTLPLEIQKGASGKIITLEVTLIASAAR